MHTIQDTARLLLLIVVAFASLSPAAGAQTRTEITINDTGVQAENLTSSQDGAVYFGSTAKGTIYRPYRAPHKPSPGFRHQRPD